jgi:hypothetical protein
MRDISSIRPWLQCLKFISLESGEAQLYFNTNLRYFRRLCSSVKLFEKVMVASTAFTEGALYDWLGEGNNRHTKRIRKMSQGLWQLVAGCSKDRFCMLDIPSEQRFVIWSIGLAGLAVSAKLTTAHFLQQF